MYSKRDYMKSKYSWIIAYTIFIVFTDYAVQRLYKSKL